MPDVSISHLPAIAFWPILIGLSGLALCLLVGACDRLNRYLHIRRARAAYRRGMLDAEGRQFLAPADFARIYGPYARHDDHRGTVVSLRERRRS